jgi:hypothetical protein
MSTVQEIWVGHARLGGRTSLQLGGPGSKVLLLGSRANDIATLSAISMMEAGTKPIILDLGGRLAPALSGRLTTYDYRSFLYDAFRLEAPEAWHAELVAAAYTSALDLSSDEEAIITSAMQAVSKEGGVASPVAVYDVMGKVEGFRGFYVDKLQGRVGSLKHFEAVEDQSFATLMKGNVLIDFHRSPYPLAAELAVSLFLAKILAIANENGDAACPIILTSAHRVFRNHPRLTHGSRLLVQLLGWPLTVLLATDQVNALSPLPLEVCPIRIYSSDAWHASPGSVGRALSGTYVLHDRRSDRREFFVPRRIASRSGEYVPSKAGRFASPALTLAILEMVESFPFSTSESVVQYLAPEFLAADVNAELTSLQHRECLVLEPKDPGSGPRVFAFTLAESGRKLLEELRK